jgi:hypothetical protein
MLQTFNPAYTKGVVVSPGAASARTLIGAGQGALLLTNTGSNICYVRAGGAAVVATTADVPVLPNSQVSITKTIDDAYVAYISASGTTLQVLPGEGFR